MVMVLPALLLRIVWAVPPVEKSIFQIVVLYGRICPPVILWLVSVRFAGVILGEGQSLGSIFTVALVTLKVRSTSGNGFIVNRIVLLV